MNDFKWLVKLVAHVPKLLVAIRGNPWPTCTLMMFVLALAAVKK